MVVNFRSITVVTFSERYSYSSLYGPVILHAVGYSVCFLCDSHGYVPFCIYRCVAIVIAI